MHFGDRAVEGDGFDLDLNDVPSLQGLEDLIQDAALGPAHHTGVDRVPGSKMLGEAPPCAALFGDIQNGIENLKVGESHIAALNREAMGDVLVLGFADSHERVIPKYVLTFSITSTCRIDLSHARGRLLE